MEKYGPDWSENPVSLNPYLLDWLSTVIQKDYLTGIMETAPEGFERSNEALAMRILQINFGSILSTFIVSTYPLRSVT